MPRRLRAARVRAASTRRRNFIREWRKHRGLTQEQLAERIDVTNGYISQVETGKAAYTDDTLYALADVLDCDPIDLLTRVPGQNESLWALYRRADPHQRAQIEAVAAAILNPTRA